MVQREGVVRDGAVVEERGPRDRVVVEERVVERRHEGEFYVAGFGGFTLGQGFSNVNGIGTLATQNIGNFETANSVIYGMKAGYFLPARLNWLGFEVEGFNTTPHLKQQDGLIGSNLRVTTLAFNVIARKRLGCRTTIVNTTIAPATPPTISMVGITKRMVSIMMGGRRRMRTIGARYKYMPESVRRYSLPRRPT